MTEALARRPIAWGPVIRTVLLSVLIGPPAGAFVFLASAIYGPAGLEGVTATGFGERLVAVLFLWVWGVPFSFIMGGIPAALVGLVIGLRQTRGPMPAHEALLLGTIAGFGYGFSGGFDRADWGLMLGGILTCLLPTLLVWALARNIRRHETPVR